MIISKCVLTSVWCGAPFVRKSQFCKSVTGSVTHIGEKYRIEDIFQIRWEVIILFHHLQSGVGPGGESLAGNGLDAVVAVRHYMLYQNRGEERSTEVVGFGSSRELF